MANHTDHYNVTHGTGPIPGVERNTTITTSEGSGSVAGFAIGALVVVLVAFGVFALFGGTESDMPPPVETTIEQPAAGGAAPDAAAPEAAAPADSAPAETAPAAPADTGSVEPAAPAPAQ